jgi:hypothetical protein
MSADVAIFDRLAAVMAEARPRFGAAGLTEKRRVIGLLSDKVPDAKREIRAIGVAIDEGVPAVLARTERHMLGVEMDRLANALSDETGIRIELARQVVRAFAFALDMGPPPSIYEAGAPAPVPRVPAPSSGDWAGLSTVVPAPVPASQPMPPPAPITHPGTYPAQPAYGTAPPLLPPAPAYQQGGYQQPPPAFYAGQAPVRRGMSTGAKIGLGAVGTFVALAVIGTLTDPEGRNRPSSATSTMAEWTCPRIAEHSVQMSQQQPIRLRSITNVRETGRTATVANCLGFAATENGETGDVHMRAYVEGTNIMVAYQGEPFAN